MAHPRVSANLPPYNPKKSTLAFGNGALPKLVYKRVNPELHYAIICYSVVNFADQMLGLSDKP